MEDTLLMKNAPVFSEIHKPQSQSLDELKKLVRLDDQTTELNAGTCSPTPLPVLEAVEKLRRRQATGPSDFYYNRGGPLLHHSRQVFADHLGVDWRGLFLLPNVTMALNTAVISIRLNKGDVILTTDHEYGAMRLLLEHVARRDGSIIKTVTLPFDSNDPQDYVDAFVRLLDDKVKMIFVSHVTSPTGLKLPLQEIFDACRGDGRWLIVDGAHAVGAVDVDIPKLDVDCYAANGHKWMMAPCGIGFFNASPRLKNILEPLVRSWGEDYDIERMDEMRPANDGPDFHCTRLQYRIEYTGVADRTPMMVLPDAIDFMKRVGLDRAFAESQRLCKYLCDRFEKIGLHRSGPTHPKLTSTLAIFELDPDFASTLRIRLWDEYRILAPVTKCSGRFYLRISLAWYYTEAMLDRLVDAMTTEMQRAKLKRDVA